MASTVQARCHCGALAATLRSSRASLPVRACGCTFCAPRGKVWTSDPEGRVEITVTKPDTLSRYRFGTGTADFLVCARCGVNVAAVCEIGGALYAVVNAASLRATAPGEAAAHDFDAESTEERLARRARTWTPAHFT